MKKSKKPIVGGILLGVGVLCVFGIGASDNKVSLIIGIVGLIVAGTILLIIGIRQNKSLSSTVTENVNYRSPSQNLKQPSTTSYTEKCSNMKNIDGSKSVEMLPAFQGDMIKVYQYTEQLCTIRDEPSPLSYIQNKVNEGLRQVEFEFEPENKFDDRAIIIKLDGKKIGYVYRGQTQDMIHDFYYSEYEVAGHINTFSEANITYKIAFYKPKSKCRANTVSFRNKKFIENTYEGEMLTVEYDDFEDCFKIYDSGEEYKLPKKTEEFASKYFEVPVEVGEGCENLIFYK